MVCRILRKLIIVVLGILRRRCGIVRVVIGSRLLIVAVVILTVIIVILVVVAVIIGLVIAVLIAAVIGLVIALLVGIGIAVALGALAVEFVSVTGVLSDSCFPLFFFCLLFCSDYLF